MRVQVLETALEAAKKPEVIAEPVACRIAQESFVDARSDFKRFQNLVYITACFVVLFLLAGIFLVALGSDTRGAGLVSFVGTVVSGLGMGFVRNERNQARNEKHAAAKLVREYCADKGIVDRLESGQAVAT